MMHHMILQHVNISVMLQPQNHNILLQFFVIYKPKVADICEVEGVKNYTGFPFL